MNTLTMTTEGDTGIVVTRRFAAAPDVVYRAHTDPQLVQKWLLGPAGWTMPVCICEARVNGKIRYEWSNGKGGGTLMTMRMMLPDAKTRVTMLATGMKSGMEASYVRLESVIP